MRFLSVALLLVCLAPLAASDSELSGVLPGLGEVRAAAPGPGVVQKPDAQKIMAELSATLRLSTRQEERLSKAIAKKSREFDQNLEEYGRNSAEEKKWHERTEQNRLAMEKINTDMPDLVKEYLDDEQRDTYENLLAARNKPREAAPALAAPAADADAPVKKRRLVRKKRVPAGARKAPGAAAADAQAAPGEEAGGVMVDEKPAPARKKRLVRKKAPAPPAAAEEPARPAGAAPTGQAAPEEEEGGGSYP